MRLVFITARQAGPRAGLGLQQALRGVAHRLSSAGVALATSTAAAMMGLRSSARPR